MGEPARRASARAGLDLAMPDKHLDIYLLRCLQAFVEEAHVTKAAERMGSTQPAMSSVLRRLREIFNDPLLVRTEKGMVPTDRARELAASLRTAIDLIDNALTADRPFDPASAEMAFEVAASESVSFMLLPHLISRVRRLAPGVQLRVRIPDLQRARQNLEEGEIDLLLSFTRTAPDGLRSSALWSQKLVVIASRSHPVGAGLTLEDYLRWPHACHKLGRSGSSIEVAVDAVLQKMKQQRMVGVWLPSAISVPAVVSRTDFLATVPDGVARMFAPLLGLKTLPPPLALDDVQIGMYWHERMHKNPPHKWLRQLVRSVAGELTAAGSGRAPINGAVPAD
jgi:DNA-binding transcriptional LysR family regulator